MYVCMYGHTYSKSMDQPGKVASPARGQLNRETSYFPVRGTGPAVLCRVSRLISILRLNLVLTYGFLPSSASASIYLFKNPHTPSGQSRVYQACNCVPMAFIAKCPPERGLPVNLKVVPDECCVGRSPWTN